ncbi:MAG: dUTP diphosphatase [Dethiobacteria bacterium]|jgi:dUTP pyrophosphatase|nr:dUTP diphosphatase [Bacillota bacterium]
MDEVKLLIEQLEEAKDLPLPRYMSHEAAGIDLYAAVEKNNPLCIKVREYALVPTGIKIALPPGYEAQIRPRSGLALKHGISVLNTPGTVDADYRGEIKVLLINLGKEDFFIYRGDRIAQMVINALPSVKIYKTKKLPPSDRGEGGFGHTGIN